MPETRDTLLTPALPLADAAYRALLEALPGMVFTTDARGRVEFISRRFADFTGTTVDALREGEWEPLIHPDDRALSAEGWVRAMAAGEAGETEQRVRSRDGTYRWFRTRIEPLREGDVIRGWLGIATDTAAQHTLSDRADEAQSTLGAIIDHAPVGMVYLDLEGRYQRINPSLAAMNGLPAADHIGRHVSEVVPDLWPKVRAMLDRIRAGEDEISIQLTGTTAATGSVERTWQETWYAVRVGGELRGVAAIVEDITQRLRDERHQSVRVAISELKNQPLGDEAIARGAIATLAQHLADWAALYVRCDDGTIERTAYGIAAITGDEVEREVLPSAAVAPDTVRRALDAGEVSLIGDIDDGVLVENALDAPHLAALRASDFSSGMTVPMFTRGKIIGAISLATRAASGRRLDERDVAFAREAASRIGAAIENARLQRDLAASEERHRRLIEASPSMVFETDAAGTVVWASQAYWEYTGLDPMDAASYDWQQQRSIHPDDHEELQRRWRAARATGNPYENEVRLRAADGTYRWFLNRLVAQRGPDGAITGWVGTGTDIHGRVAAEDLMSEALDGEQEARALLDAILQAAPVALTVIDRDLRWIHINETAARFNGFSVREHLAARVPDLLPDVWRDVEPIYRTIFETGEPLLGVELELPAPGTNDEVRSWSASYFPVSRDGQVFAVAAMYADVTDRKRADAERERLLEDVQEANAETQDALSRERSVRLLLDTVLQSAPIGIVILDTELRFARVNEALAAMNGVTVDEHIGKRPSEVVPGLGPLVEPHFRRVLTTGEPELGFEIEAETPADPGNPHWWRFNFFPITAANGERVGVAATRADITREKREGIERERLVAELREANAAKDEFLGLVSHELKTPITTIYGNAQVLLTRGDLLSDEDRAGSIVDIAYESERLHRIVDNLLILARLDRGAAINTEPVLVGRVAQRIVREHQQRYPQRPIALTEDGGDGFVLAEPVYVEQVIRNLVSNAEKYSPPGAPIDMELRHSADSVEVAVRDRGAGFTLDEASEMFEPFYRAPTSAKVASGIGIGLAVCKRLIEAQGGRVWARPRDGGGADIGFSLPLADE